MVPRIGILVPALTTSGGMSTVATFLYRAITLSGRYEPYLVSLPMSSRDVASVRLRAPASWLRGPRIETGTWNGWPYRHVGAVAAEFEFQRYRPRRILTQLLDDYDLIQVVAGTPAWAYATRNLQKPVCLQVATLARVERQALLRQVSPVRRFWASLMIRISSHLEEAALAHLASVFVENRWMYDRLRQKLDPKRVIFAPPGVDTARFHPGPYKRDNYILSVGRLADPRKNVPLLFKAYHQLRQILPTAPNLVLAGKSMPDSSTWRLAESLRIADHIEALPNVPAGELAKLYREASMFVLSSDEEGLGIVILEAMASGVPVVATQCGGPETVVVNSETGRLVPAGDVEALADGMAHILANPGQAELWGRVGRRKAEEEFSLATCAKRFLKQYDHILS